MATDGNSDEAARLALATFRLARHFERNPALVSYLVAIVIQGMAAESANRALQTGPVSKEVRQALDAELAVQERMEGYARMIRTERAFDLDSFPRLAVFATSGCIAVGIGTGRSRSISMSWQTVSNWLPITTLIANRN